MSDWTSGYVTDVGYTHGYYAELNPLRSRIPLLNAGIQPPTVNTACELGFGQGVSVNIHAAGGNAEWYANDFNPEQALFAQEFAEVSAAPAHLTDEAFAEFCRRTDLPSFDYIALHGIWSWINHENRQHIVDFVSKKLKPGGLLYISYNSLPGWAGMIPVREYLTAHGDTFGNDDEGSVGRLTSALNFVNRLLDTDAAFTKANPNTAERLKKLADKDKNYLVHEFFNRNWEPMSIAALAEWLEPTKTAYSCSANPLDHVDVVNLSTEQIKLLSEINDPVFRQLTRDMMVNQQFRKDYWMKGGQRLGNAEVVERLRRERVILAKRSEDVTFKVSGARGEATLQEGVYKPILDALADNQPKSIGQLEEQLGQRGISFAQLQQAIMVLMGSGTVEQVQSDKDISTAKKRTDRLNSEVCRRAKFDGGFKYLGSPVTGGAVAANKFQLLFLHARQNGARTSSEWGDYAWRVLAGQGQKVLKEGKALETAEENQAELRNQAKVFEEQRLPILRALKVA